MMSKMSWCWGSNDGLIREERTAFIIRRVFAKTWGVPSTRGPDFAESVTSERISEAVRDIRKYVLH